jgi:hypothetical protein
MIPNFLRWEAKEVSWEALKEGLHARYKPTLFETFVRNLSMLKQVRLVMDYQMHSLRGS